MNVGRPPEIWLVSGIPGSGQTTVAGLLAQRFERSAHIEGDRLAEWVASGRVLPDEEPAGEADRQIELCIRNQCLLARSFAEAGFTPVIDYVIPSMNRLAAYRGYLGGARLYLVVIAPRVEVALRRDREREEKQVVERWVHLEKEMRRELVGSGLWVDSSELTEQQTIDAILAARDDALLV